MDRMQKEQFVDKVVLLLSNAKLLVLVKCTGLTVAEVSSLRVKMRKEGASYIVVKNTLAKIALSKTEFKPMIASMKGPTAMAVSSSPVAAAKVAIDFAKAFEDKFEVMGGCMDGYLLSAEDIKALASLPSVDELRSKIIAVISAPAQKIAAVLKAPARQLAQVLSAYSSKA